MKPLEFNNTVEETLMNEAQHVLDKSWKWMRNVLDMLEQQLTVGEEFDTKVFHVIFSSCYFCCCCWRYTFSWICVSCV